MRESARNVPGEFALACRAFRDARLRWLRRDASHPSGTASCACGTQPFRPVTRVMS